MFIHWVWFSFMLYGIRLSWHLFNIYYAFRKCFYFSKNELMLFIVSGVIFVSLWWYFLTFWNKIVILHWHLIWCLWWLYWSQWITDIKTLLYCIDEAVQLYPGHVEPSLLLMLWLFRVMTVKWMVVPNVSDEILSLKT